MSSPRTRLRALQQHLSPPELSSPATSTLTSVNASSASDTADASSASPSAIRSSASSTAIRSSATTATPASTATVQDTPVKGNPSARPPHIHDLLPTFFLPRAASIDPAALAIHHTTRTGKLLLRSYGEFSARACALAYYIRSRSWRHVGILCPNTPAFLECVFGIGGAGAVHVAVNYRLNPAELAYIFGHGDVDAIIVDVEYVHLLDHFRRHHPHIPVIVDDDADPRQGGPSSPYDAILVEGVQLEESSGGRGWEPLIEKWPAEDSLVALAYTSGTTARPKGVELTHRGAYLASLANIIESGLNVTPGPARYLWTLPMFHATGWTYHWAVTAVRGVHYCLRQISYPVIWQLLKTEQISHFCAAPTVNTLLCAAPEAERLAQPVCVAVAASPPSGHLFSRMSSLNLHPTHMYGLTETFGPITRSYRLPAWDRLDTETKFQLTARQGHAFLTSLPVRVVRERSTDKDRLQDVQQNGKEIGEIVFVGNICCRGYYKDEAATRKLFAGGALHTGDLAVWHPDGAVQILDRAKDIIISGGENISSVSLEAALVQHPDVLEVAVVGMPNNRWGEVPVAFVTLHQGLKAGTVSELDGTRTGSTKTTENIIDWARQRPDISRFAVPKHVEIVQELSKTATGKVRKNVLRQMAQQLASKHKGKI